MGYVEPGFGVLVDEDHSDITSSLNANTWAESTWCIDWCRMLGMEVEADWLREHLRRTGSIDADHRKDLVEAIRTSGPAEAGPGGDIHVHTQEARGHDVRPQNGWAKR